MKILGLSCGRRLSNTEILAKEALMGAEEAGAEVELVHLHDLVQVSLKVPENMVEVAERVKKYKDYLRYSRPPRAGAAGSELEVA